MKTLRILSIAAAAAGFVTLGACKSRTPEPTYTPPVQAPGSYIDDGK